MLKFKFKSEEGAREAKRYIKETAELLDYMTLSEIISNYGTPIESTYPLDNAANVGWRWSDLKGRNIFVKQVRRTWYLYLCEPTLNVNNLSKKQDDYVPETSVDEWLIDEDVAARIKELISIVESELNSIFDFRLKAMVHHKEKDKIIERPCYFHKWTQNIVKKEDGTEIYQDLALCEFLNDGHMERISYDHIRFVEEWE